MSKLNTIIVAPNAGFCNRLRTMVAAIYLSEKLNMNIEHLWIGTCYQCSSAHVQYIHDKSLEYFFEMCINSCDYQKTMNKINKVYTEWMPHNFWYNYQSYGQQLLQKTNIQQLNSINLVNINMDSSESFLIESSYINNLEISKKEKHRIYKKYFILNNFFIDNINKINFIGDDIIGIHIRKGDFKIYFPETQFKEEVIINWINTIDNKIFFCSDDKEYEYMMRNKIKNAIIPNIDIDNNDIFFVDFILLSKCSKIYGTFNSSFSEEASHFGNVEYIPLTHDFLKLYTDDI